MSIRSTIRYAGGEILESNTMNSHISDVQDDLSGDNGPIEYRDILAVLDGPDGDRYMQATPPLTSIPTTVDIAGTLYVVDDGTVGWHYSDGSAIRAMETDTSSVTAANLIANGDVGPGAGQVAAGNHTH